MSCSNSVLWSIPAVSLVQIAAMDKDGSAANRNVRYADNGEEIGKITSKTMRTNGKAISTACFTAHIQTEASKSARENRTGKNSGSVLRLACDLLHSAGRTAKLLVVC